MAVQSILAPLPPFLKMVVAKITSFSNRDKLLQKLLFFFSQLLRTESSFLNLLLDLKIQSKYTVVVIF